MLQKQPVNINFAQGLNTKADPKQIPVGQFVSLQNSIFTKAGLLGKRNGYGALSSLPDGLSTYLTTFGGNLTAIGKKLRAYANGPMSWVDKGVFQPLTLSVIPVARSSFNQTQADSVMAANGLVCTVYTEVNNSVASYKYVIQDSTTGQNIVAPTVIPVSTGVVTGSPRVFLLGGYFILVFTNVITGVSHLQYVAVSTNSPTVVSTNSDIASSYVASTTVSWDGAVLGNNLYVAYNTTAGGQKVAITYLSTAFVVAAPQSFAGSIATIMSVCIDNSTPTSPVIYMSFYDLASQTGFVAAVNTILNKVMNPTQIIAAGVDRNITATAQNGICTVVYESAATYAYDANIATNFLQKVAVTKPMTVTTGTVGPTSTVVRSVGLASKGFLLDGTMYFLAAYDGKSTTIAAFQPTYFLLNLSGNVVARLAYQNGGGYLATGLPQAQVSGSTAYIAYLFKDLIQSVNKTQGLLNSVGIYSQTGVNLGSFAFGSTTLSTAELGSNLNLSGGMLYAYDGNTLNEQNFNLYPDMDQDLDGSGTSKALAVSPAGGSIPAASAPFFYVAVYQWTDAQGNIFQSAPSIPTVAAAASFAGVTNSVVVSVPTARLTYKSGIKIVIYRWSTTQQTYYQITSISAPTLNSTTADVVTFTDTFTDAQIAGNSILYTTGGVLENTSAPACTALTTFDTRLFAIDAEDGNLLNFSKTVVEGVPVEISDLLSIFIAPNAGTSINTGPMRCLAPMDDKLIIFKKDALYYINGTGPDNTGANSQYSPPIFITSTIGSVNQNSIALIPNGLMFQSDKGIWLLGRDLNTSYIGAQVEAFNSFTVTSANALPGTNMILFTLSNGVTLMYDYFYNQWGSFVGTPAVSSTIYQGLHTYLTDEGAVSQETPGIYLDNGNPVQMQFTTGWLNLAGLQGYQRAFWFQLLGEYKSPHKLAVGIAYDYNSAPTQLTIIQPDNFAPNYGSGPANDPYGQITPYGGPPSKEQWRVFLTQQRCQALQISFQEIYDPTFGVAAGAGLTLSGLNLVVAVKKGWVPISSANSAGGQQ